MEGGGQHETEKDGRKTTAKTIEPVHIISLGAGVQSSTMALMAAAGDITPMPKCAIFADTQDEPASVYEWLDWLEKQLPFPVHRVTAGRLSDAATNIKVSKTGNKYIETGLPVMTLDSAMYSGMAQRQCTQNFKIIPIRRFLKSLRQPVVQWIGISLDEAHRMKPSRDKWCVNRWPLIDARMNRNDCLIWMANADHPTPPRSACIYCPYKSDSEWRRLRSDSPGEFEAAAKIEDRLQSAFRQTTSANHKVPYLHSSRVSLREVDFSTDEDHGQQVMFGNECTGMCGV